MFAWSIGTATCLTQKAFVHKQLYFGGLSWVQLWACSGLLCCSPSLNVPACGVSFLAGSRSAALLEASRPLQQMVHSKVSPLAYL